MSEDTFWSCVARIRNKLGLDRDMMERAMLWAAEQLEAAENRELCADFEARTRATLSKEDSVGTSPDVPPGFGKFGNEAAAILQLAHGAYERLPQTVLQQFKLVERDRLEATLADEIFMLLDLLEKKDEPQLGGLRFGSGCTENPSAVGRDNHLENPNGDFGPGRCCWCGAYRNKEDEPPEAQCDRCHKPVKGVAANKSGYLCAVCYAKLAGVEEGE